MGELADRSLPGLLDDHTRLQAVLEIVRAVGSTLRLDDLLPLVMDRVTGLLEADRSTLYVLDHDRDELWSRVAQGAGHEEIRLPVGKGVAGWVAVHGTPVILDDAYQDHRFDPSWDDRWGYHTRTLLSVPVRSGSSGRVVGVIQCLNKQVGFSPDDRELLVALSGQVAIAIENASLYEELVDRNSDLERARQRLEVANRELQILFDLEQQTVRARSEHDLVDIGLRTVVRLLDGSAAALLLRQRDGWHVWSWSTRASRAERRPVAPAKAEGLLERLGHPTRQVVSAASDDTSILFEDVASVEHITSAPLRRRGELLGILQVVDHQLDAFDDGALRLLALLAAQLGHDVEVQRARTAEQRHERLMAVGKAVSAVLHDLRTPLSAVDGYVAMLDETPDPEERQEIAERIRHALHHTEAMTREILEFARGHHEVRLEALPLDTFVEQARQLLAPEIERAGATLRVDKRWSGTVHFDRSKVMRIVTNLVRNACQAMAPGGQITWTLDRDGNTLCMRFRDNGPGIPRAVRSHLFEFFTTHGKHGGTGLGLAMARQIADTHDGTVRLRNSSPAGTTFEVCLPVI